MKRIFILILFACWLSAFSWMPRVYGGTTTCPTCNGTGRITVADPVVTPPATRPLITLRAAAAVAAMKGASDTDFAIVGDFTLPNGVNLTGLKRSKIDLSGARLRLDAANTSIVSLSADCEDVTIVGGYLYSANTTAPASGLSLRGKRITVDGVKCGWLGNFLWAGDGKLIDSTIKNCVQQAQTRAHFALLTGSNLAFSGNSALFGSRDENVVRIEGLFGCTFSGNHLRADYKSALTVRDGANLNFTGNWIEGFSRGTGTPYDHGVDFKAAQAQMLVDRCKFVGNKMGASVYVRTGTTNLEMRGNTITTSGVGCIKIDGFANVFGQVVRGLVLSENICADPTKPWCKIDKPGVPWAQFVTVDAGNTYNGNPAPAPAIGN